MEPINMTSITEALLQLSILTMIGLYFVFSNTVMQALARCEQGAIAMIEINKQILNRVFLTCFGLSAIAGIYFFFFGTTLQAIAGAIFFVGTTVVTASVNVPLNNRLKEAGSEERPWLWQVYLTKWCFWNHIRTGSAVISGFLLSM